MFNFEEGTVKKLLMLLAAIGMLASFAYAHEDGMEMGSKGKEVTLSGTLVDINCYLKDGHTGDDHDAMKKCGRDCLRDGLPAGLLVDKKLYTLVFPGPVFADFVGKTVEISGDLHDGNILIPEKASVVEKSGKKPIKLKGKVMM
jgi:hypothetical protein